MRYFVITGHRAATTGDFKLDDITGGAGRMDILCRCVNSSFFLSHNLRRDVDVYLVLQGGDAAPKTVRFCGGEMRYLNPDERSTSSLIRNALLKKLPEHGEVRASPGVYISRMSFDEVLAHLSDKGTFVHLMEDGTDCRDYGFPEDPIFVLGDDRDLTSEEEASLLAYGPDRIRLGPLSLHADHCIIVAHNEMDRRQAADQSF